MIQAIMGVVHGMDRETCSLYFLSIYLFLKKIGPSGRVISAANWQAW